MVALFQQNMIKQLDEYERISLAFWGNSGLYWRVLLYIFFPYGMRLGIGLGQGSVVQLLIELFGMAH